MKRDFSVLTPVEEALERMFKTEKISSLEKESVPVYEAYRRVLGENVVSNVKVPPFPSALMDGYAVQARDTATASEDNPVRLRVAGNIVLGKKVNLKVGVGETCFIPTGGFLPQGADAVVKVEDVKVVNSSLIEISRSVESGTYVSPAGEDVKKGETILKKGHILRAQDIGILTALRIKSVRVVRKPVVAVLSVGDELVDYRCPVSDARKVPDSHRLMIVELLKENGAIPLELGIAPDDIAKIVEKLREGLAKSDLVLTIGGCSQGKKDFVPDAINSLGNPGVIIHGVAVKPGRVTGLAFVNNKPIVILPGLPQSTIVGFILFALPLVRTMLGLPKTLPYSADVKMKKEVRFRPGIKHFVFVKLEKIHEELFAVPLIGESNLLRNIVNANGFIITSEHETTIRAEQKVSMFLL